MPRKKAIKKVKKTTKKKVVKKPRLKKIVKKIVKKKKQAKEKKEVTKRKVEEKKRTPKIPKKIEKPKKEKKPEKPKKEEMKPEKKKEEKVEKKEEIKEAEKKVVEGEPSAWIPKTSLGKAVMKGKITDINKILDEGIRIRESEIVDALIPNLESELILIGGRPGKGGGIERTPLRISAKMHKSGRRYAITAFAVVGNKDGIIGMGKGRAKQSRGAINKAIKRGKLNLIKVPRGCGSWECGCGGPHSIPFRTEGKSGSVRITLMPAPRGIGLAVDDETKKVLTLAGISDVWGKTLGNTGTRINLIIAVFSALKNLHRYRTSK